MDRAAPPIESFHALELRVTAGPQRGARAPLKSGAASVIAIGPDGQADDADIVLRDDQSAPVRIRLNAELPDGSIEVLQGQVQLDGQLLPAGRAAKWRRHTPLAIGSATVAFGRACLDEWPIEQSSQPTEAAPRAAGASRASRSTPGARERPAWHRRADVWLAATGAAVLLLSGGVLGVAHLHARQESPPTATMPDDPVARLNQALRESEFSMLDLTTRGNGQVVIRGRLATAAQRDDLSRWLQDAPLAPVVEVAVDEELVREVTEIFRVNGIAVSAKVAGPGSIAAEAAERDAAALARAEEVVRRDVRGLEALSVRNTAKPVAPPAPAVNDDPGKRIASLVAGASAYLVTVDGARYFVGAMLPTGHRIVAIEKTAVALERDGQKTSLKF